MPKPNDQEHKGQSSNAKRVEPALCVIRICWARFVIVAHSANYLYVLKGCSSVTRIDASAIDIQASCKDVVQHTGVHTSIFVL